MPVKDNYVVFVTGMLYNSIGADTVLKLRAQTCTKRTHFCQNLAFVVLDKFVIKPI